MLSALATSVSWFSQTITSATQGPQTGANTHKSAIHNQIFSLMSPAAIIMALSSDYTRVQLDRLGLCTKYDLTREEHMRTRTIIGIITE